MPIAAQASLVGSLVASGDHVASFVGEISDGADPHFEGDLVPGLAAALDGPAVLYGARVVLGGDDVTADLVGPIHLEDSIDEASKTVRFTVSGSDYSPTVTVRTWTRTPTQIYFSEGPPGDVVERLELDGYVLTCSPGEGDLVEITVGDAGALYRHAKACFELAPLSSLTRGQVCSSYAQSAGIPEIDAPDGGLFRLPVIAEDAPVLEGLQEIGEPVGWSWRWRNDQVLEAWTPQLRLEPEPPDHVWHVDALDLHPRIVPPQSVASRWIVSGHGAVLVDEVGIETVSTTFRVEAPYAPRAAIQHQDSSGNITASGHTTASPVVRPIREIVDETQRRGDLQLRQVTTEWGFYNPRAAKWTTGGPGGTGNGPVGDGYYYADVLVDEDGEFVAEPRERWMEVGRRVQEWTYDSAGNLLQLRVIEYGWRGRTKGVRAGDDTGLTIDAYVGGDDLSYEELPNGRVESYGRLREQVVTYAYDDVTGALVTETTETYEWYSPRTRVDDPNFYVLADGSGQRDVRALFILTGREIKAHNIDASGRLRGETLTTAGYNVRESSVGLYDWGGFFANVAEERFGVMQIEHREIAPDGEDSYLEVSHDGGRRREQRRLGSPPVPRYLESAWTRLVRQPVEAILDDPTLEALFGRRTQALEHPYVQSAEEALALLERLLDRELSFEISVQRAETAARPGDTVLLIDPLQGLSHRALLVGRKRARDLSRGDSTADYVLEVPLRAAA